VCDKLVTWRDLEHQHGIPASRHHRGVDIDALSALASATADHSQQLLGQKSYRRYAMHDLISAYATTLANQDPADERRAAFDRLFDHYAHLSSVASSLAYPAEPIDYSRSPTASAPCLAGATEARAWLDAEIDNLLAVTDHATLEGRPDHLIRQSATLHRHLSVAVATPRPFPSTSTRYVMLGRPVIAQTNAPVSPPSVTST
jgi:hypothetical protein